MYNKKAKKFNTPTIIILAAIVILLVLSFSTLFPEEYSSTMQPDADNNITGGDDEKAQTDEDRNTGAPGGDIDESVVMPITYDPKEIDVNYLTEKFHFLQNPLPGTVLSWKDSHLPGSERPYRSGIHQGLDFYGEESGGGITLGTPVLAAAPGRVIRIDHDYELPTTEELTRLSDKCRELGETPEDILDIFRGRQLWVEHEKGFVIRYCHLEDVAETLQKGDYVETGDEIATMGYSGTTQPDRPHLHLEIWFDEHYLGEGMTVKEIRKFFEETIFQNQESELRSQNSE